MKKRPLFGVLLVLSLVLSACGGANFEQQTPMADNTNSGATDSMQNTAPETVSPQLSATETVNPAATMDGTPEALDTTIPVTGSNANAEFRLSSMLSDNVVDAEGNDLGDVNDLVISVVGPSIAYVLLGTGEQQMLVPFDHFTVHNDGDTRELVFKGTQDSLVNGPVVDLTALNFAAPDWDADFADYWGSFGNIDRDATGNLNNNDNLNGNENADPGNQTNNDNTDSGNLNRNNNVPDAQATGVATPLPEDPDLVTSDDDNSNTDDSDFGEIASNFSFVLASELLNARVLDEGEFMGMSVSSNEDSDNANSNDNLNANNGSDDMAAPGNFEAIGDVQEVVVDPQTGILSYIVVAGTELIERADRWVPVPFSRVMIFADPDNTDMNNVHDVVVVIGRDLLRDAPDFDVDMLPDLSVDGWDTDLNKYWDALR